MSKQKTKEVLSDHKRIGKKFIPPLMQLNLNETNWIQDMIPELLWIGLLNKKHGLKVGTELAVDIAKCWWDIVDKKKQPPIYTISNIGSIKKEMQEKLLGLLESNGSLHLINEAFNPLLYFYPKCPISFFSSPDKSDCSIGEIKDLLTEVFDKTSVQSTFILATAFYIGCVLGRIKINKNLPLANFPEIEKYPKTELSREIAGSLRAMATGSLGIDATNPTEWSNYFWKRGREIEPCFGEG